MRSPALSIAPATLRLKYVSLEDTISSFEAIVNGEMDEYAENTFAYVGSINEVVDKAKKK